MSTYPIRLLLFAALLPGVGFSLYASLPSAGEAHVIHQADRQFPDVDVRHEDAIDAIRHVAGSGQFDHVNRILRDIAHVSVYDSQSNAVHEMDLSGGVVMFLTGFLGCSPPAIPQLREMAIVQEGLDSGIRTFGLHFSNGGDVLGRREALMLRKVTRATFPFYYTDSIELFVAAVSVPSVLVLSDGELQSIYTLSVLPSLTSELGAGRLLEALKADATLVVGSE